MEKVQDLQLASHKYKKDIKRNKTLMQRLYCQKKKPILILNLSRAASRQKDAELQRTCITLLINFNCLCDTAIIVEIVLK